MRMNLRRLEILLLLLALSVGFGFAFDGIATAVERHSYPMDESIAPLIAKNADDYGVPPAVLWATACVGSGFASNAVSSDGAVGLMQITPARFAFICAELLDGKVMDAGMLYEPATNLQCGAAWLSHLYEHYHVWELVYVAYHLGTEQVDAWLADPSYTDENGILKEIPDGSAEKYATEMAKAVEIYTKLYFEP